MFAVVMIGVTIAGCLLAGWMNEKHEKETGEKIYPFI